MEPRPVPYPVDYTEGKLSRKTALVTGGDSGIGRAVALLFAKEGADVTIVYLDEHEEANDVKRIVEGDFSRKCLLIAADLSKENACKKAVATAIKAFPKIDILVNNAAIHYESKTLADIDTVQLLKIFSTNVFSMFWVTKAILPFMKRGASIINTTSVTAYWHNLLMLGFPDKLPIRGYW